MQKGSDCINDNMIDHSRLLLECKSSVSFLSNLFRILLVKAMLTRRSITWCILENTILHCTKYIIYSTCILGGKGLPGAHKYHS